MNTLRKKKVLQFNLISFPFPQPITNLQNIVFISNL